MQKPYRKMKKFVLTSAKFEGQIMFWYSLEGALIHYHNEIDFTHKQHCWMLKRLPLLLEHIEPLAKEVDGTLAELPEDISFERFWNDYPRKVNKKRTLPLYEKLNEGDAMLAVMRLKPYLAFCSRTKFRNVADPEKYIRDRYFETDWSKEK
jgi:hypothetical protein